MSLRRGNGVGRDPKGSGPARGALTGSGAGDGGIKSSPGARSKLERNNSRVSEIGALRGRDRDTGREKLQLFLGVIPKRVEGPAAGGPEPGRETGPWGFLIFLRLFKWVPGDFWSL